MKINTQLKRLLFSTVQIVSKQGESISSGTGFIYNATRPKGDISTPVLITNKHVIDGAQRGQIRFVEKDGDKPKWGSCLNAHFDSFEELWVGHPDPLVDIAAMPIGPGINQLRNNGMEPFFSIIPSSLIPKEEIVDDLDALQEVTFIGYPASLYDNRNYTPIIRRGITATPLQLKWNGTSCFLIDASVFPGSSGSPVFIADQAGYVQGNTAYPAGSRLLFLGIVASVHQQNSLAPIIVANTPYAEFSQMIDLGVVFNWRAVEETVDELCRMQKVDRDC